MLLEISNSRSDFYIRVLTSATCDRLLSSTQDGLRRIQSPGITCVIEPHLLDIIAHRFLKAFMFIIEKQCQVRGDSVSDYRELLLQECSFQLLSAVLTAEHEKDVIPGLFRRRARGRYDGGNYSVDVPKL
jgi:hypothetical protein